MSEGVASVLIMEWHSVPKSDPLSIYPESNTFLRQILVRVKASKLYFFILLFSMGTSQNLKKKDLKKFMT